MLYVTAEVQDVKELTQGNPFHICIQLGPPLLHQATAEVRSVTLVLFQLMPYEVMGILSLLSGALFAMSLKE